MGAKLGLTVLALERLLAKLDAFGMQRSRYELGAEFIADSLSEDLVRHVPGMRFRGKEKGTFLGKEKGTFLIIDFCSLRRLRFYPCPESDA
jgi:hypothetical protein